MAAVKKVEEALASIRKKTDALSGAGVDLSEEFAVILDAVGSKLDEPEVETPPQPPVAEGSTLPDEKTPITSKPKPSVKKKPATKKGA